MAISAGAGQAIAEQTPVAILVATGPSFFIPDVFTLYSLLMSREFLPGNCTTPDNKELFIEADHGGGTAMALAKAACEGCVQLPHCTDQTEQIAIEIAKQNTHADSVIIGGADIPLKNARINLTKQSNLEKLREPALEFDIKNLPETFSPRQTLEVIRQAMRARQIRVEGRPPNHKDMLEAFLRDEEPLLKDIEADAASPIVEAGAAIILRHRAFGLTQHRKAKPLTNDELERSRAIFREFTLDAIALSALGVKPRFAQYHSPELYPRLIDKASASNILAPSIVRDLVRQYAIDPVSVLDQRFRASKSIRMSGGRKTAPAETKRYERELSQRHGNATAAVSSLRESFKKLSGDFPDIDPKVCAHIAYRHPGNPAAIAELYKYAYTECLAAYADDPFLTPHLISEIILRYPERGAEAVQEIRARAEYYQQIAENNQIRADTVFLGYAALATKSRLLNADELSERYRAQRTTRKSSRKYPLLTKRFAVRAAEIISDVHEYDRAMICASNLVRRGLCSIEQTKLVWSSSAEYLTDDEKCAVLAATGLDRIVDQAYDDQLMCDKLGVDSLTEIVDRVLVPRLLPVKEPRKNILAYVRYYRSNQPGGRGGKAAQERAGKLVNEYDLGGQQFKDLSPHSYEAFQGIILEIADIFSAKPPKKERIRSAVDEFFIDYSKIGRSARRLSMADLDYLGRYSESYPNVGKSILSYAALYDTIPLRFMRSIPNKQKIIKEYEGRVTLSRTDTTRIMTASPDILRQRLDNMVRLLEKYESSIWVFPSQVQRICARSSDPEPLIAKHANDSRELATAYSDLFDRDQIINMVINYKNPTKRIAQIAEKVIELERLYPDPEYSRYVFSVAATRDDPDGWLVRYKERYQDMSRQATPGATINTVKRLAATHVAPDAQRRAISLYNELRKYYEFDDYIESWMIDDVVRYSTARAMTKLGRLRYLLSRGVKLRHLSATADEATETKGLTLDYVVQQQSTEDTYIASQEQEVKRNEIQALLDHLTPMEQAAVLVAYDIDVPLPADLSDIHVMQEYGAHDTAQLASIVNATILPRIKGA